jgi:hypothetical protein
MNGDTGSGSGIRDPGSDGTQREERIGDRGSDFGSRIPDVIMMENAQ